MINAYLLTDDPSVCSIFQRIISDKYIFSLPKSDQCLFSVYPANGSSGASFTPTTIHQMRMDADLQNNTTRRLINETHGIRNIHL